MKQSFAYALLVGSLLPQPCSRAQTQTVPANRRSPSLPSYPTDLVGILVQNPDWTEISGASPAKTKTKHGIAASLSYGVVPATIIAEYTGLHAQTQVKPRQPTFCLCHLISLPGDPIIVRLHPRKETRELDGGNMIVYPIVGGSKQADANKSDLIAVDVSHPDPHVWLVRPQGELEAGEYALMLGTQNMSIFPFTVVALASDDEDSATKVE
jgi:hypothetical protein